MIFKIINLKTMVFMIEKKCINHEKTESTLQCNNNISNNLFKYMFSNSIMNYYLIYVDTMINVIFSYKPKV